jgi:osmotically-inducible protein OsmY
VANSDRYRRDDGYGRDDRGFVDRATDEVRSWFGDDEAEARRRYEERGDQRGSYRGAPPQGRAWADRGGNWDRDDVGRDPRMFPESAEGHVDRGPGRRDPASYAARERDRGGWDTPPRAPWPEDHGETTPQHGPAGSWREWRGRHASYGTDGGWHVGKGPSGYTRSDERIREDVCDRLTDDPYVDATHVEVSVQGGEVTLGGSVDRREDKRRAEDIAERVSGVREVNNRLRVGIAQGSGPGAGTTTTPTRA